MTTTTPDVEARELLACALTDNGQLATANAIRSKQFGFDYGIPPIVALRAIQAALTQSATAADLAYEDAARVAEAERAYRMDCKTKAIERKAKGEARDFESMAIACTHVAAAIRLRKSGAGDHHPNIPENKGEIASDAGLSTAPKSGAGDFQSRVQPWMTECFGPTISADRVERGDRLAEEVFELLQSSGYDPARLPSLIEYVWGRAVGEPSQEVGGAMVTLAAYCLAHGLDMHMAGEVELARINQPAIIEKIRAKQAAKARDIPFSPLPVAPPREGEL